MRILVLLALVLTGLFAGMILMIAVLMISGTSLQQILDGGYFNSEKVNLARLVLLINHLTMFLLPALAWAWIYYRKKWLSGLGLDRGLSGLQALAGIFFLIMAYPIVSKSFEINQSWDLPAWMGEMEGQTAELLKILLKMDHGGELLFNLLIIALIPGIGEELIFRGIIQQEIDRVLKKPWLAVVFSSLIFSAIHFQFEGFLPRFLLGMILGLLLMWTRNLWLPILVHAFNNGMQVVLAYFIPEMSEQELEESVPVTWLALVASVIVTALLGYWFHRRRALPEIREEPEIASPGASDQNDTV
jgi:membrane protease YdiL (CAAX protease family)